VNREEKRELWWCSIHRVKQRVKDGTPVVQYSKGETEGLRWNTGGAVFTG
jgi:hypothetical protein